MKPEIPLPAAIVIALAMVVDAWLIYGVAWFLMAKL